MVTTMVTIRNLSDAAAVVTPWNVVNVNVTPFGNVTTPDAPPWSMLEKMVFGTWLTISMLCAVFGNLMVIVVVIRHKGMRTRTNMFLVNLAVADFLVGILLAPFALTTVIHGDWIFGEAMCAINGFLNAVCFITSIHTLMYISIHKYVSITRPFSRILNHWKILVMIACAWLWAIICALLTMFLLSKVVYKPKTMQCGPEYPKNGLEYLHHTIIQITGILLPLGIMTFAYARMYCEFRQHAVRLRKNTTLQSDQILGQQIQVTKTLFIVLACFMLCWLPYFGYTTYVTMKKNKSEIPGWTNALAYCFMYMNSGCNPIIYAWRSPSFREGYKEILCQRSSYIVSDDTIRDSDSPSIIRRLSTMLHGSFRNSRITSRKSSEDGSSLNSPYLSRSVSASSPTHTLLKRATSKTAKGSSIIRRDGAIIITKNGKIISVRRDTDSSMQRDRSFSGFEDIHVKGDAPNGVSKSVSDINVLSKERLELSPLLRRNRLNSSWNSVSDTSASLKPENNNKFYHSSLSKIDSVDESSPDNPGPCGRSRAKVAATERLQPTGEVTPPIVPQRNDDKSVSPSTKSDLDDVFVDTSPKINITFNSQENMLSAMPLEPSLRRQNQFAKSDMQLDAGDRPKVHQTKSSNPGLSRSTNVVYKVPLLKCPSVERLDIPGEIPRCSSDAGVIGRPASPLYKRRWLANKRVDQIKVYNPK